jgi:hypothetical protein
MAQLKEMLTKMPAPDGKPVFETGAELAKAVGRANPHTYKSERSTATLLSGFFNKQRKCPGELRSAILQAIKSRFHQLPKHQEKWLKQVEFEIDALNAQIAIEFEQASPSDEKQFDELLDKALSAKHHFIIAATTAEEEEGNNRAEQLNTILLQRLGIAPKLESLPDAKYEFLLPDLEKAKHFWKKLWEKASAANTDKNWTATRLKFLAEEKHLTTFVVPRFVCGCPIVVYDPEQRYPSAFSFSHHRNNVIDTIEWDPKAVDEWKKNFFEAFVRVETLQAASKEAKQHLDKFYGYRHKPAFE